MERKLVMELLSTKNNPQFSVTYTWNLKYFSALKHQFKKEKVYYNIKVEHSCLG